MSAAKQNAYLQSDVTVAQAKNAVKISKDAADDLEFKIKNNEKGLTDFSELPWVKAVNGNYKTVLEARDLEGKYVQAAKEYLAELKGVNKYNEQTIPLLELTEQVQAISGEMNNVESADDVMAVIDELIAKLDQVIKLATPLQPAESLKESHEFNLKSVKELEVIMKQIKTAVMNQDIELYMTAAQAYTEKSVNMEKQSKALEVKFVEKSKLTQLGNKLNALSKEIDAKTANW